MILWRRTTFSPQLPSLTWRILIPKVPSFALYANPKSYFKFVSKVDLTRLPDDDLVSRLLLQKIYKKNLKYVMIQELIVLHIKMGRFRTLSPN